MSFVCIVCRDSLTNAPRAGQEAGQTQDSTIVVTRCGHLFHLQCIQDWFNHNQRTPIQECPYCKNVVQTNDFQRIFPTGDEDTEDINALQNTAKNAKQESEGLKIEITQLEVILDETAAKLEEINLAHDLLSYEFAQQSSELESLKREKEEEKNMDDGIKRNLETMLQVAQSGTLVLENKLKEAENQLQLQKQQAEIDRQRLERDYRLNDHGSQNYELLFNELKNLREQFNSSLTSGPAVAKKPNKSTGSQTEGIGIPDSDRFQGLSRSDIYKLCIEFLEKERIMAENHPVTENKDTVDNDAHGGIGNSVAVPTLQNTHNGTIRSLPPDQMRNINGMNSYYDQMEKICKQPPVLCLNSSVVTVENGTPVTSSSFEAARLERQKQYYRRINSERETDVD